MMNKQSLTPVHPPYLWFDGRGPSLIRWLRESDLYFPFSETGFAPSVGYIVGAEYDLPFENENDTPKVGWVVFHESRVMQFCDVDAHSFWHIQEKYKPAKHIGVWEVHNSFWKSSFNQEKVNAKRHYIVEFYDDIVEVLCKELIFGTGRFNIEDIASRDSRFSYAYLRKAMTLEKEGDKKGAIEHFREYIKNETEPSSLSYAQRSIERLLKIETK